MRGEFGFWTAYKRWVCRVWLVVDSLTQIDFPFSLELIEIIGGRGREMKKGLTKFIFRFSTE